MSGFEPPDVPTTAARRAATYAIETVGGIRSYGAALH